MISALDRKLLRDLRRIGPQIMAIALVLACGIMVLIMAEGTRKSLVETRATYYDRYRFADVFAGATRAPRHLIDRIAAIDGVGLVEGRVVEAAVIDLQTLQEAATARVISLPEAGGPVLNVPLVRSGRLPDPLRPDEIAVSEPFALANGLAPGDGLRAILNGQARDLVITGTVISPEFIYTLAPGSMMPDDRRYALIWMGERSLAAAFDLDGAFNDVSLTLLAGAAEADVIARLDALLAPYGGTGAHGRDRQQSHAFLNNELTQLDAMATYLPPIFLLVSAFLVNMVLGRLIRLERLQIGLLKAVGYSTRAIMAHYMKMTLGIGVAGVLMGWAGGWRMGLWMTELYTDYFRFPFLIYDPGPNQIILSAVLGLGTVALGAVRAVIATARLAPAVAMTPPAPAVYRRGIADWIGGAFGLAQPSMMILRSITRWPGRAGVTVFGVSASVAVLVASYFVFDIIQVVMEDVFEKANRQHVTLTLAAARNDRAVIDAMTLPGVRQAEGSFALPIRIGHAGTTRLVALTARDEGAALARVLDDRGQPVRMPPAGLAVPESLAEALSARPGDMVTVELLAPPRETWELPVVEIVRQSMGQDVHMASPALFAMMRQPPQVNAIHLLIDRDRLPDLHRAVTETPAIAGLIDWVQVRAQFQQTMDRNISTMAVIYSVIGMLITLGVIYNAARIQLSEREHELASLRVLGFSRREVSFILVGELMLLSVLAVPLGWLLGYGFASLITNAFSSEIISLPMVIDRRTYAYAAVVVLATAFLTAMVVRRRLDRVDLVSALKQRE